MRPQRWKYLAAMRVIEMDDLLTRPRCLPAKPPTNLVCWNILPMRLHTTLAKACRRSSVKKSTWDHERLRLSAAMKLLLAIDSACTAILSVRSTLAPVDILQRPCDGSSLFAATPARSFASRFLEPVQHNLGLSRLRIDALVSQAQELLRGQYAAVGAAGVLHFPVALKRLGQAASRLQDEQAAALAKVQERMQRRNSRCKSSLPPIVSTAGTSVRSTI